MCGIVAIASRPTGRPMPDLVAAIRELGFASETMLNGALDPALLRGVADRLSAVDVALRSAAGVVALQADSNSAASIAVASTTAQSAVIALEARIEDAIATELIDPDEAMNAVLVHLKDATWAISRDRIRTSEAISKLCKGSTRAATVEAFYAIQLALSSLDRLEVRGRDSAGIHLLVRDHQLDFDDQAVWSRIRARSLDPLFSSGSVRVASDCLSFVYKHAAEVGELGDNTAALRAQIMADELLTMALQSETCHVLVLAHTRWASIGIISEPNCHPLNHEELSATAAPYVAAALNGDVDNYAELSKLHELHVATEITTDAKVIPALVSRRIASGSDPLEAFRSVVTSFEGSVAIGATIASEPDSIFLAQRGSGQALYVGLADGLTIVASEPYGVVEIADRYFRLDGETSREPGNPSTQGEIVVIDGLRAGSLDGIHRIGYEGVELPLTEAELRTPEITTRDIDRGEFPHFLLKEMSEAPASFHKTLRGKLVLRDGLLHASLPNDTVPVALRERLRDGEVSRIFVIGQGTAAVAGQNLANTLRRLVPASLMTAEAVVATELSGFGIDESMRDVLIIAISQSGTTTDTNRTVDVARERGALVISIVNRRQSDLVDKSDGVMYTSDGRDVEMSVASTKAFYAQIAAGFIMAYVIASEIMGDLLDCREQDATLRAVRGLPEQMREVLTRRPVIAQVAQRHAPQRKYWALVGNGANRTAAQEVRIKLSELCYKSIACDFTEDKKHIDLSAEPLVLVCAAGLSGSTADDVGKEVSIYRSHKAAPIVICDDGETRFADAVDTLFVPAAGPRVAFVLSAMVGHLFGYEAALAIDATAVPLREMRGVVEAVVAAHGESQDILEPLAAAIRASTIRFGQTLTIGGYDGTLSASISARLAAMLRYANGLTSLDTYELEFGRMGTPSAVIDDLTLVLTTAIEELTRPIDAIKHQAKTVTVGISRSDETLLVVPLVQQLIAAGCARDHISYRSLRMLVELDLAVDQVIGFTRYGIEGDVDIDSDAQIKPLASGGIATSYASRTDSDPVLRGTKHRAAFEREVTVFRGRSDGRTGIIVPEAKNNHIVGLTLMHVRFHDRLAPELARRVLQGYRGRYSAIRDVVTEVEPEFKDDVLGQIDLVDLLTQPVVQLAENWRS